MSKKYAHWFWETLHNLKSQPSEFGHAEIIFSKDIDKIKNIEKVSENITVLVYCCSEKTCSCQKKIGSQQKIRFLFYFFFIFKTKQTFILKLRKKKGKHCFVFLPKKGKTKMTSKHLKRGYYF